MYIEYIGFEILQYSMNCDTLVFFRLVLSQLNKTWDSLHSKHDDEDDDDDDDDDDAGSEMVRSVRLSGDQELCSLLTGAGDTGQFGQTDCKAQVRQAASYLIY